MRLVFFGTPEFAVPCLERLVEAGNRVEAVYTQPDRPKGRGGRLAAPPVKEAAARLELPVFQPQTVKDPEVARQLETARPEAIAVVGFGQIIPPAILAIPPLGVINVHASLLPKYRGAAPVQWAIARGETVTGVTTMRMDARLDTGDILLQQETPIGPQENAVELASRLSVMGAGMLVATLEGLAAGRIAPRPQDHSQATHAPVLKKEDGRIDWTLPPEEIYNRVRGFVPWPGAWTVFRGRLLRICSARVGSEAAWGPPGSLRVAGQRLLVACGGRGSLEVAELQLEGRQKMDAGAFLRGRRLAEDERFREAVE